MSHDDTEHTREPQYQPQVELRRRAGLARLGLVTNQAWHDDPRRLLFILARYKFVARMLAGHKRVLEVGCGDAFASRLVQQEVGELTAVDFDPVFVADAKERMSDRWRFECRVHDLVVDGPVAGGPYDAAYGLDVLEHIPPESENAFLANLAASVSPHAMVVIGTPSATAAAHASAASKAGHVNLKDAAGLRASLSKHFRHVLLFSMNDEVVHTGFYPMAHYLLAVACEREKV